MFGKTLLIAAAVGIVGAASASEASDQKRFEGLLRKYALRNSDLQVGKFKPKGACVCRGGSDANEAGFLLWLDPGTDVVCMVPKPFVDGAYSGSSSCSGNDWEVLAK